MATKDLDVTELYQRLMLPVNTWFDLLPFQTFDCKGETSTYKYKVDSNSFDLVTYRPKTFLPSSRLIITRETKNINGVSSDFCFSIIFQSYRRGDLDLELRDNLIRENLSDWHAFVREFFYQISNTQRNLLVESLLELQLVLYNELKPLERWFNRTLFFEEIGGKQ